MKPVKSIYPSYSIKTGETGDGTPIFFPKMVFLDNGSKYIMKLVGKPYPLIIDRIKESLMINGVDEKTAKAQSIAAMEMVFFAMDELRVEGLSAFKIIRYDEDEEEED